MERYRWIVFGLALAAGSSTRCTDSGEDACIDGTESCDCTAEGACLAGLSCLSGRCVALPGDDSGATEPATTDTPTSDTADPDSGPEPTTTTNDPTNDPTSDPTNDPTNDPQTTGPADDCGNGIMDADEDCDDGNTVNNDACDNECDPTPKSIWAGIGDMTDYGGSGSGQSYTASCQGNGVVVGFGGLVYADALNTMAV